MAWVLAISDLAEIQRIKSSGFDVEEITEDTYQAFFNNLPGDLNLGPEERIIRVFVDYDTEALLPWID